MPIWCADSVFVSRKHKMEDKKVIKFYYRLNKAHRKFWLSTMINVCTDEAFLTNFKDVNH